MWDVQAASGLGRTGVRRCSAKSVRVGGGGGSAADGCPAILGKVGPCRQRRVRGGAGRSERDESF